MYTIVVSTHRFRLLLGSLLLFFPLFAHAEERTVWDFSQGTVPGRWTVRDFAEATMIEGGLHLKTGATEGLLWRTANLTHPIDVVTIKVSSRSLTQAALLWHQRGDEEGILTKLLFVFPASETPLEIDIVPGTIKSWDPETPEIGFEFPTGSDVLLQEVRLRRWSPAEKFVEAWKSFWTFDTYRPYSINFLWGPLLATSPPARALLFQHLPPRASSAVRLFYLALLLAGFIGAIALFSTKGNARVRRIVLRSTALLAIGLWLLFDLRMGAELLSYAANDVGTHVLPPPGKKTLRNYGRFYDVLAQARPSLTAVPRYGLIADEQTPYYQNLRYYTYPSLPVLPEANEPGLTLLFAVERPDLRIVGDRILKEDGKELARDGRLLLDFGSGTFLYGTR